MDKRNTEVLVGCYGEVDLACIHWLNIHAESGEVTPLGEQAGIANPSFLVKHPVKNRVYAISEAADGEVVCYELDYEAHRLKERRRLPTHGGPCYAEVSACGKYLFISNYSNAGVVVFALDDNGDLQEEAEHIAFVSENRQASRIHTVRQIPETSLFLLTDIGKSNIYLYQWDEERRSLLPFQSLTVPEKAGPRHVAFHPEKPIVYVVNEYTSTVSVYQYAVPSDSLQCIQTVETVREIRNYGAEIQFLDGKVITSNRGSDTLSLFKVTENGTLEKEGSISAGGEWPRHFCSNQWEDKQLFVCHQHSNNLAIFKQMNGTFSMMNNTFSIQSPACIIDL